MTAEVHPPRRTQKAAAQPTAVWVAISAATWLSGCGAGTAAAVSGGGGGGGGNAPPSMSGFTVLDPKLPAQARVRFLLADAEANPAEVELFYQAPGRGAEPLTQAGSNPAMLATSSAGVEYALPWNFAAEPALPDDAHFVDGVQVFARVEGGIQEIVLGANAASTGLGNDAPVIDSIAVPAQEASGIVGIEYTALDSSSDVISVRIEYDIQGDDPDFGWRLVRPALAVATPLFAVQNVVAQESGTELSFFWDTNVDLAELEHDVKLRFTALDPVVEGGTAESAAFRVDNNEEPIVTLSDGLLFINPDQRNGIPIPYTVHDQESDEVELVFQWKFPDQSFPPLPPTKDAIHALLADPEQRRIHHICSEYPTFLEGRAVPIDATSVRFPELAITAFPDFVGDIAGRELEVLRQQVLATPIASTWAANPLNHPVAVLPLGDGLEVLVLDGAGAGAWRVQQIELATGAVTRVLVSAAPGEPDAMAFEPDQHAIVVASHVAGAWSIERVALDDGELTHLIAFDGATEQGRVRAIASVGRNGALITVGDSLVRLDYDRAAPRAVTLFDDLATPWGIALDPFRADHVYLAEHDAPTQAALPGRIVVIDLARRARRALSFGGADPLQAGVSLPRSLAFDRRSTALYVVEDAGAPEPALVKRIDISGSASTVVTAASVSLPNGVGAVASGPDGLILAALEGGDLAVGGGVEQRRAIQVLGSDRQTVRVAHEFRPALEPLQRLRIAHPSSVLHARSSGSSGYFVWDSADAHSSGDVQFRAVPLDSEAGVDGITKGAKAVRSAFDVAPQFLYSQSNFARVVLTEDVDGDDDLDLVALNYGSISVFYRTSHSADTLGGPYATGFEEPVVFSGLDSAATTLCAGDLDGDGDLDLATANSYANSLSVIFQTSPRVFGPTVLELGDSGLTDECAAVVAADLDGDEDLDLASANTASDSLTIFFQTSPGEFGETALSLTGVHTPTALAPADLDGDGDVDLVSNGASRGSLCVFLQTSPGVFGSPPLVLGDASQNTPALAVSDLDGDGDRDIVCVEYDLGGGYRLVSYVQTSAGGFLRVPFAIEGGNVLSYVRAITPGDLDADGDVDFALVGPSQDGPVLLFQSGPGVFRRLALDDASQFGQPLSLAAGDLDGDGAVDLVSTNTSSQLLTVFRQARRGFHPGQSVSLSSPWVRSVAAADLDADGDLDLASANADDGTLRVFVQSSLGIFEAVPLVLGNPGSADGSISVAAADLDSDGDLDLASANSNTNSLSVFFQQQPGVFGPTPLSLGGASVTDNPRAVVAADLDGDGDQDLASANGESNDITVFFQGPAGAFSTTPLSIGNSTVMNGPESLAAADLDGDGDVDLVTANLQSHTLTVFFQESPGSFGATPLRLGNEITRRPRSIATADLDGNGDLDLVSLNEGSRTLTVFFQRSGGAFDSVPLTLGPVVVSSAPASVTATDFDGDGDLDLLACSDGYGLNVFVQTGAGVFADAPLAIENSAPGTVAPADLDADGDLDFVYAWTGAHQINVVWNKH